MRSKQVQSVVVILVSLFFGISVGYYFGVRGYELKVLKTKRHVEIINKNADVASEADFGRFWEVWDIMLNQHITKPLDVNKLVEGAIKGMVASVGDPHSVYLNPEENVETKQSLNGEYEGIGAQLDLNENGVLIIVAPLDDSPAQRAGIKAGDLIIEIEGESTAGYTVERAVNKIRGEAGTFVTLSIVRKNNVKPLTIKIKRGKIKIDSVKWEDKNNGIAYIRLGRFGNDTNREWQAAVSDIISAMPNLNSIILDMRNNPGGLLNSAVYIASEFIDDGLVVEERVSDGTSTKLEVTRQGRFTSNNISIVVLIDQGSASASEIVAAALKERRDALIVGTRSFGKGSVQKAEQFEDGAALHVTIAKWLTPDKNWIDSKNAQFDDSVYNEEVDGEKIIGGIKPDYEIEFREEDIANETDIQLDKALELLKR